MCGTASSQGLNGSSSAEATVVQILDDEDEDEDGVQVVVPAPAAAPEMADGGDGDEEIAMVGRTGQNSLGDFPHPRHDCPSKPFTRHGSAGQNRPVCDNCFCFVCDLKADECPKWDQHCGAWNGGQWTSMRAAAKRGTSAAPLAAMMVASSSAARDLATFNALLLAPRRRRHAASTSGASTSGQAEGASRLSRQTQGQRS
mmetsp:Transcript_37272/g.83462  ORF Transcript_37272/g.83462 Transcript_37272/m.83462 type:complete len:200 (+) Transcript_37272:248-847(+)